MAGGQQGNVLAYRDSDGRTRDEGTAIIQLPHEPLALVGQADGPAVHVCPSLAGSAIRCRLHHPLVDRWPILQPLARIPALAEYRDAARCLIRGLERPIRLVSTVARRAPDGNRPGSRQKGLQQPTPKGLRLR